MFKSNYITPEDNWFFCLKNIPQESKLAFHNDSFRLGELRLHLMASSGKMFKDGSLNVSIKLKTCTLDDLREGIERATSRFVISQFAAHVKGWHCAWHCLTDIDCLASDGQKESLDHPFRDSVPWDYQRHISFWSASRNCANFRFSCFYVWIKGKFNNIVLKVGTEKM